jgi:hypothetical protein
MLQTGFPQADVDDEFRRARRRQVLAGLGRRLRRRPATAGRLPTLDEALPVPGLRGGRYLGVQTIPLDTIVGSAESRPDFDRHFRPTSGRDRERWEEVALAERRGVAMPPIEVYRAGGLHYVSDGLHRVSIAAATGQQVIDAYVTGVPTAPEPVAPRQAPGPPGSSHTGPPTSRHHRAEGEIG